jgi:glucosamine kinase
VALKAYDGRISRTPLASEMMRRFQDDPLEVIAWTDNATATDYARFAPLVLDFAEQGDVAALEIVRVAAREVEGLAKRLFQCGTPRVALVGGLAPRIHAFLAPDLLERLVPSMGDAIDGALLLARGMLREGATVAKERR